MPHCVMRADKGGASMAITRNKAQCLRCSDIVESLSMHHLEWCSCKGVGVSGGTSHLKRIGSEWRELAEYTSRTCAQCGGPFKEGPMRSFCSEGCRGKFYFDSGL